MIIASMPVDWGDFQLITWSKDKTLRFWPIDQDVLQVHSFLTLEGSLRDSWMSFSDCGSSLR